MTDLIEKFALFYYLALLDESKAYAATINSLRTLKWQQIKQNIVRQSLSPAQFVRLTQEQLVKAKTHKNFVHRSTVAGTLILPEKSNWGPWFELKKNLTDKEFHTLIYARLLKIQESDIAEGMEISVGTVRYRIGKTLQRLGHYCAEHEVVARG